MNNNTSWNTAYAMKFGGKLCYVWWRPQEKPTPHRIWNVGDTLEIECTHSFLDMENIEKHVKCHLAKLN